MGLTDFDENGVRWLKLGMKHSLSRRMPAVILS